MSIKQKILSLVSNDKFYFVLIAFLFVVFLFRLTYGVTDRLYERWDEQTNVQVVKEMVQKGGVFPEMTLLGEPFFEKPPLWYWLTYIVSSVFGIDYVQMRIVSILSGIGIWLLLFYALNKYKPRWLTISWLIIFLTINQLFVTNAGGIFSSHTLNSADLDALQIFFILGSLISFVRGVEDRKFKWIIISQAALGLSVLSKGPTGLILYALQIGFFILNWKKCGFKNWQIIIFSEIIWFIVLPWYVYMSAIYGGTFITENIGYHVIKRGLTVLEGHSAGIFYYLNIFTNNDLNPLWFFEIILYVLSFKKIKLSIIAFLFLIINIVTFSIVGTKLAWYIIPSLILLLL